MNFEDPDIDDLIDAINAQRAELLGLRCAVSALLCQPGIDPARFQQAFEAHLTAAQMGTALGPHDTDSLDTQRAVFESLRRFFASPDTDAGL